VVNNVNSLQREIMMSPNAEKYIYSPLIHEDCTRVLILHPARTKNAPIRFILKEISLADVSEDDKNSSFDALSYVWGSPVGDQPVFCDDKTLLITKNCLSALRHLRLRRATRTLWIDAICIDQSSLEERSRQVKLMGRIYGMANEVLIWLGEGTAELRKIFWYCRALAVYLRLKGKLVSNAETATLQVETWSPEVTLLPTPSIATFAKVTAADYFCRAWTLQEFVVSRNPILMRGRTKMPWNTFFSCASETGRWNMRLSAIQQMIEKYRSAPDMLLLYRTQPLFGDFGFAEATYSGIMRPQERQSPENPVHGFIDELRIRHCSDARDKIFAMHHLCKTFEINLGKPDYRKPVAKLYIQATVAMIAQTYSLFPLVHVLGRRRTAGLPSWVPDYNAPPDCERHHFAKSNDFANIRRSGSELVDGRRLRILAKQITTVATLSDRMTLFQTDLTFESDDPTKPLRRSLADGVKVLERWLLEAHALPGPYSFEDFCWNAVGIHLLTTEKAVFIVNKYDAMVAQLEELTSAASDRLKAQTKGSEGTVDSNSAAAAFVGPNDSAHVVERQLKQFLGQLFYDTAGSRMFITSSGGVGFSAGEIKAADEIVLCHGASFPMIVRPARLKGHYECLGPTTIGEIPYGVWPLLGYEEGLEFIELV
jgi:hypothetical protein